jgi:hypothetical protein
VPSGLYLYDTTGAIQYSSTTRLLKFIDSRFLYLTPNQVIDVYIPDFAATSEWIVYAIPTDNTTNWSPDLATYTVVKFTNFYRLTNKMAIGTTTYLVEVYKY